MYKYMYKYMYTYTMVCLYMKFIKCGHHRAIHYFKILLNHHLLRKVFLTPPKHFTTLVQLLHKLNSFLKYNDFISIPQNGHANNYVLRGDITTYEFPKTVPVIMTTIGIAYDYTIRYMYIGRKRK